MEELKWIRIFTPYHIPRKYVEQLKGVNFSVDRFYQFQEKVCVLGQSGQLNPLNHLYVLANKENVVKGFIWAVVDDLGQELVIQNLSIDAQYWEKGQIIEKVIELLEPLREKAHLKKVVWITRAPKHAEKYGFRRSKEVLCEYDPEFCQLPKNEKLVEEKKETTEEAKEEVKKSIPKKRAKRKIKTKKEEEIYGVEQ